MVAVIDCCHSGTAMDLPYVCNVGDTEIRQKADFTIPASGVDLKPKKAADKNKKKKDKAEKKKMKSSTKDADMMVEVEEEPVEKKSKKSKKKKSKSDDDASE